MGNCQEMGQQDNEFLWLPSIFQASLHPVCLCPPQPHVLSCPGCPPSPPGPDRTPHISFLLHFPSGNLSTTELTLMNPPPIFLPLPMKGKATGMVSLTMLVTNLPGKFSLRIPTTLSSDLLSGVPITLPLIFILSHP